MVIAAAGCLFGPADRRQLLGSGRRALEARVRTESPPQPLAGGVFDLRCGAFVSLHRHSELRGCLGRVEQLLPLGATVVHLAGACADSDRRFPPVDPAELLDLCIEISVLTQPRPLEAVGDLAVGRHGVLVEDHGRRGLLLPQVAAAHGWDPQTFLDHACVKAGLGPTAWRERARVFIFEAEVFAEPS